MTDRRGVHGPITRRRALVLGVLGLGSLAAACTRRMSGTGSSSATTPGTGGSTPSRVLTPEVTQGPYYLPLDLVRSDITEGKEGVPLQLNLKVVDATTCQPVSGAAVDIWHADALGVYSGVASLGGGSAPSTSGSFLRGVQSTGSDGVATFHTIYPGWYMGRAVHIHVKVHNGGQVVHTGQLFFGDTLTSSVYRATAPYNTRPVADTTDTTDMIYQQAGGSQAILDMKKQGSGYLGTITMGINT
jgi:protocatechuate 3,4-dioxygenase beta subunit